MTERRPRPAGRRERSRGRAAQDRADASPAGPRGVGQSRVILAVTRRLVLVFEVGQDFGDPEEADGDADEVDAAAQAVEART